MRRLEVSGAVRTL